MLDWAVNSRSISNVVSLATSRQLKMDDLLRLLDIYPRLCSSRNHDYAFREHLARTRLRDDSYMSDEVADKIALAIITDQHYEKVVAEREKDPKTAGIPLTFAESVGLRIQLQREVEKKFKLNNE